MTPEQILQQRFENRADLLERRNEVKVELKKIRKEIKKVVEEFPERLVKQEKLNKRLNRLSGRNPEEEMIVAKEIQQFENILYVIDYADTAGSKILSSRERFSIRLRMEGLSLNEIGHIILMSGSGVGQTINRAYGKMAELYHSLYQ